MGTPRRTPRLVAVTVVCVGLFLPSIIWSSDAQAAQSRHARPSQRKSSAKPKKPQAKFVVYFYFAPEGCPHCRSMAPEVQRFYQEFVARSSTAEGPRGDVALANFVPQGDRRSTSPSKAPAFDVKAVRIPGWGTNAKSFKRSTGMGDVPVVANPGLRGVSTNAHPVVAVYNRETRVTRVASIGEVSYSTMVQHVNGIASAPPGTPAPSPATGAS